MSAPIRKIGFVSCTKRKKKYRCKAELMYSVSPLFKKAYRYARSHYDVTLILSAKYGVLQTFDVISPYDRVLQRMRKPERLEWAERVSKRLEELLQEGDELYFHAGKLYREHIIPALEKKGLKCHTPLEHLQLGEQLRWYNEQLEE